MSVEYCLSVVIYHQHLSLAYSMSAKHAVARAFSIVTDNIILSTNVHRKADRSQRILVHRAEKKINAERKKVTSIRGNKCTSCSDRCISHMLIIPDQQEAIVAASSRNMA